MSDPENTSAVTAGDQQLLAEHRRIRELTRRLEETGNLGELLTRLTEFRAAVVAHFLSEEAADGFYDTVRSMAPRQIGRVDQLEREHQALLADIDALAARALACLAGPVAEVLRGAPTLARRLRHHEAAEDEILFDTLYGDLGQGD
ncbi:MAG: hemerythrin domain-containing protein [Candidatus Rokubacteria bacterium]|nr:hemerythrin domain-containing protein [Candidatus Rokubacteria bacterium]